jgi:hypothetical protein
MSHTLPISEACGQLGALVRRASTRHERTTITDHGEAAESLAAAVDVVATGREGRWARARVVAVDEVVAGSTDDRVAAEVPEQGCRCPGRQ